MSKKISFALVSREDGGGKEEILMIGARDSTPLRVQSKLNAFIAHTFSEIVRAQQSITDEEEKTGEKFKFAQTLALYSREMKNGKLD